MVHTERYPEEELDPQENIADPGCGCDILRHGLERPAVEREDDRVRVEGTVDPRGGRGARDARRRRRPPEPALAAALRVPGGRRARAGSLRRLRDTVQGAVRAAPHRPPHGVHRPSRKRFLRHCTELLPSRD